MSGQETMELKPPSPNDINRLRNELRSLQPKGTANGLDNNAIEEILHLPPSLFYEAIRQLVLVFGPLSSFPASRYPFTAVSHHDEPESKPPKPIVDDGASFLEDALAALTDYNKLLEDKVAKFKTQSTRSLVTLQVSSKSEHNITALQERTAEVKQRKLHHAQQIAILRELVDSYDKNHYLRLEDYSRSSWNEVLFLNCYNTFSENSHQPTQQRAPPENLWDEYDYVLQHIERWRRLVNVDSDESEAVIDRAREHVNQLVYSITRHCQAQLAIIFHESFADHAARPGSQKGVQDEVADIIKEIDWLWEEVIPVAHMSVTAQYLRPVLNTFENWKRSKTFRDTIVTTYASGVLKFMNDRLSAVAERTRMLIYHHQALNNIGQVRQSNQTSGQREKVSTPPTRAQDAQTQRKHSKASENLQAFMRIYGAVPIDTVDTLPKPTAALLDEYVQARAHKGDTLLHDLHRLFEATTKSSLTDRELGGELLLESLLADSAASSAHPGSVYKDTQLEGSIAMLRGQAEQVQEMFESLKLEGPTSPSDYVAHSYRQTVDRLAAKVGEQCLRRGDNSDAACKACVRCLKFEEFVRRWGS
ncbi:hypothetical protein F4859DRAFT_514168 [Xylaria cf. heliscus]|nr:hypothetical protein F4859DRAFT_514168 [Xylaria cf. heliscus]